MRRSLILACILGASFLPAAAQAPAPDARRPIDALDSVFIEELTWMEVRDALKAGKTTVLVATGGVEQNGPYLATGKHNYVLKATTEAIARKLGNALVAPIVAFVPEGDIQPPTGHMKYPGTISLTEDTYERLLIDICSSFRTHGFERIVLIGDSGGNQTGMKAVAAKLNGKWAGGKTHVHFIPEYYDYAAVTRWLKKEGIKEKSEGLHDDFAITAMMMTVDPTTVRMKQRIAANKFRINGVELAPAEKTIEWGKKIVAFRAEATVKAIQAAIGTGTFPDYQPVVGWPKLPDDLKLGAVSAVATDSDDRVYVLQRAERPILVFDRDGKFLRSFGDGLFKTPHGLRIDPANNVWTTDMANHTVLKFDSQGKLLMTLGKRDEPGDGPDRFNRPTDVAVAPTGEFFISDGYGNSRVLKFSKEGKFLKQWGRKGTGAGEFNLPHAIVLDAKGRVYVGDRENKRIQIFDADGKFLSQWKESGAPYGLFLRGDRMFVADALEDWVKVLDMAGKPLGRFGRKGAAPGQFNASHMLCVDSQGAVYVAEVTGKRVQKFVAK